MSASANKKVVLDYLQALADGRRQDARDAFAEDAVYRPPPSMSHGNFVGPAEIFDIYFAVDKQLFDTGIHKYEWKIVNAIAENDTVAVEMSHKSKTTEGTPYETDYHVLFGVRNGKIQFIREYFDSLYIQGIVEKLKVKFPTAPKHG